MKRLAASILLALLATGSARAEDPIRDEAKRRHDALLAEGFNLTREWSLAKAERPIRVELLVPPVDDEHELRIWLRTQSGEPALRLLGPSGDVALQASGRELDLSIRRRLGLGTYTLEIDPDDVTDGGALFGVKGPLAPSCRVAEVAATERAARPDAGFQWPYLLFRPTRIRSPHLLVAPNNTGFESDDLALLRAVAACEIRRQSTLAERLGTPLLVPLFPRPAAKGESDHLYLHALTRAALETRDATLRRVDLQLLAMVDDARQQLADEGVTVDRRVLLRGFSASGSFAQRFALLHPDRVLAVACGSPGGWPTAPLAEWKGEPLTYPVGIADLEALVGHAFDSGAARRLRWLFFLGDRDENDAVPYRDSFSAADEIQLARLFGTSPVARWKPAEALYREAGLRAQFVLYPGVAHSLTPEIDEDVGKFFEGVLGANR